MFTTKTMKMKADDPRLANVAHCCIWQGCTNSFHGDMPDGWTWQINYHDRKPTIMRWTPKQWVKRPYQDLCLCPEHTHLLNTFYKPNSGVFDNAITLRVIPERNILDAVLESLPVAGNV
jgi:hypothetical protein